MSLLSRIILHILANALAILVANRLIGGFVFFGDWADLLIASAVLGFINSILRPILKFLTFPVIILTLGLFSILINIALLMLVTRIVPSLQIDGFWSALWAVITISLVNGVIMKAAEPRHNN